MTKKKKIILIAISVFMFLSVLAIGCFADEGGTTTTTPNFAQSLISGFTTSLSTMVTDVQSVITSIMPNILQIAAVVMLVMISFKLYKKFVNKAG